MNDSEVEFRYVFVEQKEFCIIRFIGHMSTKNKESLEECLDKVKSCCCKYFLLNFRDVTVIEKTVHRFIVQLQQIIRNEKECKLKICSVKPKWKRELIDDGIIKSSELYDHPKLAISDFIKESNYEITYKFFK